MCTVSYLPRPGGGYILTSNRDESPRRNATEVRHHGENGFSLIYPVDPGAGGSWFCISDRDRTACMLNGAYEPFTPDPRYTQSRGKVLLDAMLASSVRQFAEDYDLSYTAPFTLVIAEDAWLYQLIWDGTKLDQESLDHRRPAFWSSVTLYPEDVRKWRRTLFLQWLETHKTFDQKEIMHFHRYGSSEDPWNGFVMNREERVRTLSITSVQKQAREMHMIHEDLLSGQRHAEMVELIPADVAED
jgi:hypothetical protein